MTNSLLSLFAMALMLVTFTACSDDDSNDDGPGYEIPDTYNFENVDYSGQTQRLGMLFEMKQYMAEARQKGVSLDADRLKAMYTNDASTAMWAGNYDDSKQIKSKTIATEQKVYEDLIDEMVAASQSDQDGSEGIAGVVKSNDGAKSYLLGEDGLDHAQVIEKGLMGACFYFQATSVYMGEDRMDVDNETVEPGIGTAMEHHWDEAFGYFGVPTDFPANTTGLLFWGIYSNNYNGLVNTSQPLMEALIRGRAAISNNDLATRDQAIADARTQWERVVAASAVHYLNVALNNPDDLAIYAHGLSEGVAFIYSLKFNPDRTLSLAEIDQLLVLTGGNSDFMQMNLYQVTPENLRTAKNTLVETFGFESVADQL